MSRSENVTFPILVEPHNGQFSAQLVGEQSIRFIRPTREDAISAIEAELQQRVLRGELISVEVAKTGALAVAGKFTDDPTLQDICDEIYAQRDRQRDESVE
jgi:hypothetical protein